MADAYEMETAILQRLSATQKIAVMNALWQQAWNLKLAGLRHQHPDWTEAHLVQRVRELMSRADA
jgi:hypothetical protein